MGLSITESYRSFNYGIQGKGRASKDKDDSFETMGSATSVTTSSDKGKNIGVTTVGNRGYIAKYADTSTEADPVIKVGDYEIHVNDVDPRQATGMEMFALMSYMDDKGLTDNSGMKSYNKMTAYSNRPEYNENDTWSLDKDWVNVLNNAKESFFSIPDTYQQGLNCQSILESLGRWSNTRSGYDYEEVGISDYSDEEYAGNHVVKNKNEYFAMAKDDMIVYQGVVFMCDRLTDTLTLGDVSDPNNCIRVGLSKGGSLLFNRNDAGSLMNAITMFSPEDQERIVKAIQIDNMAQKARKDVENAKSGESVRSSDEAETDTDRNEESYEHI